MTAAALPLAKAAASRSRLERMRAAAAAAGAVAFAFSTFVIGPAVAGTGGAPSTPAKNVPAAPAGVSPSEHEAHHRLGTS